MFDRFGKMRSVEELNAKAEKLKYFGDKEGLKELCIENGIMLADAHCYMEGITAVLATLEEAATGRIYVELKEIDARESVMICGIVDMLRYVVRSDDNLQRSVLRSDKSAVDCLGQLMEALVQAPARMPEDITPWGKLAIPDLSLKSVEEIVRDFYAEEVSHV